MLLMSCRILLSLLVPMLSNIHVTDVQLAMGNALQDRNDTISLPRAYPLEMLGESLGRNVLVAVRCHQRIVLGLSSQKHQMVTISGETNMHVSQRLHPMTAFTVRLYLLQSYFMNCGRARGWYASGGALYTLLLHWLATEPPLACLISPPVRGTRGATV